jgi:glutathione S-transferase
MMGKDAMLLIGMLDSPYVRRAAIAGTLLGLEFEHRSISVFRHMERFRAINPLIKAPSFVAGDGTVLMDSELIITHLEDVAGKSLRPEAGTARTHDLRTTGIALVVCEKAVQLEYERKRPEAIRFQPWVERVRTQLGDALLLLDEICARDGEAASHHLTHGSITAAVAVGFIRFTLNDIVDLSPYPALTAHADRCEATPAFKHWPVDRETP